MAKFFQYFSIFLTLLFIISCSKDQVIEDDSRPYDPWVFRSVIDEIPRAITFALGEELWVTYSAQDAALYKAWKGSVDFDGAVYTSAHGPQPKIIGNAYIHNQYKNPWLLKKGGKVSGVKADYKGHRFVDDQAEMMYEIVTEDGNTIKISERPEIVKHENGIIAFDRLFQVSGLSDGEELGLQANFSSIIMKNNIETNGTLEVKDQKDVSIDKMVALEIDGIVWMNPSEPTSLKTSFPTKPLIKNNLYKVTEESVSGIHEGLKLITKSDCRTCHNIKAKTVGPSYLSIAKRYPTNESSIQYLKAKVRAGGSGIWGVQAMTPHPNVSNEDLEKMVSYILELVPSDEKENIASESTSGELVFMEPVEVNESNIILGSLVKVYNLRQGVNKLPDFNALGKPIMGGLMPKFDNMGNASFVDLKDNFGLTGEGYLNIEKDMKAIFRMWSDDGSKLFINDSLIVDNDGSHSVSSKEAEVGLKKGFHSFRIEYFNGAGGKFLSFNWKPESKSDFEIVPLSIIYHDRNMQESIRRLTLPMSAMNTIPGNMAELIDVHPSFTLSQARPQTFTPKVGGMDFLPDGRLVVSTWDAVGGIYIIENVASGNPATMTAKRIASGLAEPLGVRVVDGNIYVMQKQEITKLVDSDGDDIIDEYIALSNDWEVSPNFHEFGFGLEYKDNHLYATLATAILPGGASAQPQIQDRGKVVKVNIETGDTEFIAHGLRTPNGIGLGPDNEIFVADNQGDWLPSSKILHVSEGDFFGGRSVDFKGTALLKEKAPVVWLPQDEIGNSPSQPSFIDVGPYKGQMIHGEVTHGGIKRVFVEKVNGEYQGALFRFTQGLEAGVNRLRWGPDGALYVGGIGNPGNWQHTGRNWYGLQRLEYNGASTFEMLAIRAKSNGLEIEFTEALREGQGWNASDYEIQQWYYKPTAEYGGPKLGLSSLPIKSVNISEDRKRVFLEITGMKRNHVVYVHLNKMFISEIGHDLWSTESWYTLNNIPSTPGIKTSRPSLSAQDNTLTPAEIADGWELLFDGKTTSGFRNYNKESLGSSWKVANGELYLDSKLSEDGKWKAEDGGDLMTDEEYENFEFTVDWKISNCGNSGIIYMIHESDEYERVWHTGPEMQILDNTCHPDTKYPTHRAGDLYDLIEGKYLTVNPAGEWNTSRIVAKDGNIEHWQNGRKIVEYSLNGDQWKEMVAKSKFADKAGFGAFTKGHISLQDHNDPVWFKNIKIRNL